MDNGACSYSRYLDGDRDAFEEIMKELFPSLLYFINSYVHDEHTAEDLAIDAFTELIVHPRRYNFKVTLKTYLFTLGRSRALDHLKRKKIIEFCPLSPAEDRAETETPQSLLEKEERILAVRKAIESLAPDIREAVYLVYLEEMTYNEAAQIMKKSKKQIDNLLYRGKKELKNTLGKELF